ncbi:MAG: murein biosynthesis integral membrane protein MurJ, partial [Clostridium sp.]
ANNIINIIIILSIVIVVVGIMFPNVLIEIFVAGFSEDGKSSLLKLVPLTLINILFLGLNACFTTILQVHEDFIIPSLLGLFFNLPMILYLFFAGEYSVLGLTIANVIGNMSRVVFQIPSLIKNGYRYEFYVNVKDTRIKRILIIIMPVLISAGASQLNFVVDRNLASHLESGSYTALDYSQRLIFFINSIITAPLINIIYPVIANKITSNNLNEVNVILKKGISYLVLLLTPITIGILILNKDIVSIVYERGLFGKESVNLTSMAFMGYSIGVMFTGVRDLLNSTLFALGLTKITTFNGIIGVIINIILSVLTFKYLGVYGIALSASIAMIVTSIPLLRSVISRLKDIKIKDILIMFIKVSISSLIMGVSIVVLKKILIDSSNIVGFIGCVAIGVIIYLIAILLLDIDEVNDIKHTIYSKLSKGGK